MYTIFDRRPGAAEQLGIDYSSVQTPCPPGQIGYGGVCIPDPTYNPSNPSTLPSGTPSATPAATAAACPSGTYSMPVFPGLCVPIPAGSPGASSTPVCPSGQAWAPALNKCMDYPMGVEDEGGWNAATDQGSGASAQTTAQPSTTPGWWSERSTAEKGLIIGGAAIAGFMVVSLLTRQPSYQYAPNLVRGVKRSPSGIPIVKGKRFGRSKPPPRYIREGASKRSDYAYPERFLYRIDDRSHTIHAKGRFEQYKRSYPMAIRREIAGNINKAARRFGLAPDVTP
jgi:hypothetical protein